MFDWKALTMYAFRETNRDFYELEITLTATKPTDPPWEHTVRLNSSNFATRHEFTVRDMTLRVVERWQAGFVFTVAGSVCRLTH